MHEVTSKTSENIVDDNEYWKLFDQEEISLIDNEDDEPEGIEEVIEEQQLKLNRFNLIPARPFPNFDSVTSRILLMVQL